MLYLKRVERVDLFHKVAAKGAGGVMPGSLYLNFYLYSYELRHLMTQDGSQSQWRIQFYLLSLHPKRQQILQLGKMEMRAAGVRSSWSLRDTRAGRQSQRPLPEPGAEPS
jgi:hypothetical protein